MKKGILGNFAKFTGKHLRQGLFFDKVTGGISKNTFFTEHLWTTASKEFETFKISNNFFSCLIFPHTLREKCPNTVFTGPNRGKYGPEKAPSWDTFHTVIAILVG